ncbi:MAG: F0F1 ATP synthase subunit epsilon [Peptostreptococcaceae bacterium]|nr:F0F1 ATP synthase subunit epsilon [Peptostreptococcaceae bacterium]
MANNFHLEIVTPYRMFYDDDAEMVIVKTITGEMGILNEHMPSVVPLDIGILRIKANGKIQSASTAGGFVTIGTDKTTIITDCAEWADEIDVNRAENALERAQQRLDKRNEKIDIARAELAIKKAFNRIKLVEESGKKK